ncbi:hypothetical protein CRUP_012046 [Coryphaenoides rupestris]|nr:hypothetical protein CRUP_012046 [Coryphaenoides rupestris]
MNRMFNVSFPGRFPLRQNRSARSSPLTRQPAARALVKMICNYRLSLLVQGGGGEELEDTGRSKRDSRSVSVSVVSDRTADRRSKGVLNLLFKSKSSKSEDAKASVSGKDNGNHF